MIALDASAASGQARGPSQSECLVAYESGQKSRIEGDLLAARTAFLSCSQATCPAIVQTDCSEWMRDLDKRLPTITVSARWSDGTDIMQARVLIDGKPVAERLDGKPISVNPGQHRLSVEVGDRRAEQALVANEGEKARLVRFVMDRPAAPRDVPDAPPPEAQPSSSGPGALPWVLAGVSVAALAGFGYFAIKGTNELSDLRDSCGPNCTDESLDDVKRDLLIADILLAASIVSAGASITLFVVSAPPAAGAEPTRGAFATVSGRF